MPLNFERQTPAENRFERDVELLFKFTHSVGESPELEPDVRSAVELFAEDYIDFGSSKSPSKYILELYQLQTA